MKIVFRSVYRTPGHEKMLYDLLKQRPASMSISHERMPSFSEHRRFLKSRPYKEWGFIVADGRIAGSIYLSKLNEIGIFLFKAFRGKGLEGKALEVYVSQRRSLRLLANVSLGNKLYARLFRRLGFKPIQNSYCLPPVRGKKKRR